MTSYGVERRWEIAGGPVSDRQGPPSTNADARCRAARERVRAAGWQFLEERAEAPAQRSREEHVLRLRMLSDPILLRSEWRPLRPIPVRADPRRAPRRSVPHRLLAAPPRGESRIGQGELLAPSPGKASEITLRSGQQWTPNSLSRSRSACEKLRGHLSRVRRGGRR